MRDEPGAHVGCPARRALRSGSGATSSPDPLHVLGTEVTHGPPPAIHEFALEDLALLDELWAAADEDVWFERTHWQTGQGGPAVAVSGSRGYFPGNQYPEVMADLRDALRPQFAAALKVLPDRGYEVHGFEDTIVARYFAGDRCPRHFDAQLVTPHLYELGVTLALNDPHEYEDGETIFYPPRRKPIVRRPERGHGFVYPLLMEHEVAEVTSGERRVLLLRSYKPRPDPVVELLGSLSRITQ